MFAVRVGGADLIEGRLNAEAYAPEILEDRASMRASGLKISSLADLVRAPINNSIRNVTEALDTPGASVPMYRPADISGGWCDDATAPRLPTAFEAKHAKSRVKPGDIVLGIAGSIAIAGRVPPTFPVGNVNGSSARIAPRPGTEGYLLSYLNSRYGRSAMLQWAVGAVQRHLNLEDLPDVDVAVPGEAAQRYIGSKIRHAEALREWARVRVDAILSDYDAVARKLPVSGRRHATVSSLMLRDRLDAEHYPDEVLHAFAGASAQAAVRLAEVTTDIFAGSTLPAEEGGGGVRQATVATLDRVFLNDRFRSVQAPRGVGRPYSTHDLSIAAAAHTASYIGKDVTYAVVDGLIYPSTEVLTVRPDRDRLPASWLWCFLKSPLGYRQVQACVRGISAHAYPDDIREVIVQMPTEELCSRFNGHDETMVKAHYASLTARALVAAARLFVEALIERKVTEAELIEAGKDPDADRALLARLAEDGLDGVGAPLFSDLDGLAEMVAGAEPDRGES
jgi:type I restriction enzyme S subunit